jgi:hypothetical protein
LPFCDEHGLLNDEGTLTRTYAGLMKFIRTLVDIPANAIVTVVLPVFVLEMNADASPLPSVSVIDGASVANAFD